MASFRRGGKDASLRLYSLPRRELQDLCKQYGVPTYTSNVAMADALSALCAVSVDVAKPKVSWAGSKTIPVKVKWDRGLPEASLVPFTSNRGKRKTSPVNLAENPRAVGDTEEANSLKLNTVTPLRRAVKRSERNATASTPSRTRDAVLQDRSVGRSVAATNSHRPQAHTPGKRRGKGVGGDAGCFSGFVSTPKASELQMRRAISKHLPEPIEVSHAEIEFRNAALHKELFGVRKNVKAVREMEQDAREEMIVSESSEFEFRDMALHKELFGSRPVIHATSSQGHNLHSPVYGVQGLGASSSDELMNMVTLTSSFCTSTGQVLDCSGRGVRILSSIREEDARGGNSESDREIVQGRDLGLLLDGMCCESPACSLSSMEEETVGHSESSVMTPTGAHVIQSSPLVNSAATPLTKIRSNIGYTLTKATSILEKLAALRADAEKKSSEGYWEPGNFSATAVACRSPAAVFHTALVVDRDLPSSKKARLTPKSMILGLGERSADCEDADVVFKTMRIPDVSKDYMSGVSDKENRSPMTGMDDSEPRKLDGLGKEFKKGEKTEALKDRSMNMLNNKINKHGVFKLGVGEVRPEELSLRRTRAQFKGKIKHLEASKCSDLRPWSKIGAWKLPH